MHGGPGAPGSAAGLARALGEWFHVFEPFQRGSGDVPLTVTRHVEDLATFLDARIDGRDALIVGHSWGAMLTLAFAAAHPERATGLVLIGCGTFDVDARRRLEETRMGRLSSAQRDRLSAIAAEISDPNERMRAIAQVFQTADSVDPIEEMADELRAIAPDMLACEQTWNDVVARQSRGEDPDSFVAIRRPVLMIHGADDPHPGAMIADGLRNRMPQLEYRELPRCGHTPWFERAARDEFFSILTAWIDQTLPREGTS